MYLLQEEPRVNRNLNKEKVLFETFFESLQSLVEKNKKLGKASVSIEELTEVLEAIRRC